MDIGQNMVRIDMYRIHLEAEQQQMKTHIGPLSFLILKRYVITFFFIFECYLEFWTFLLIFLILCCI